MKKTISLLAVLTLAIATAQDPELYSMRSATGGFVTGGTNAIPVSSTNALAGFDVSEHGSFTATFTFHAMAASTSTVQIFGYRSLGLSKWETTPSYSALATLNGTTDVTVQAEVGNVGSVASYKFSLGNTNASVAVTNVNATMRFKAPLETVRDR